MKYIITHPDGTEVYYEGAPQEIAEFINLVDDNQEVYLNFDKEE